VLENEEEEEVLCSMPALKLAQSDARSIEALSCF
jgi:hypothetical protein